MECSWPALYLHSTSVANLALKISTFLCLNEVEQERIITGALLHDIGKMFVKREIIEKPGPLTDVEWAELKEHPSQGASMVAAMGGKNSLIEIIRYHHEWWNGKGYEGLKGNMVPWTARVIALADALDAMTSARPYRRPLKIYDALEKVHQGAGIQFDPELVATLAKEPFWKIITYRDPNRLEQLINEEKQWLVQLKDTYADLSYPLVYAQNKWLDRLLEIYSL